MATGTIPARDVSSYGFSGNGTYTISLTDHRYYLIYVCQPNGAACALFEMHRTGQSTYLSPMFKSTNADASFELAVAATGVISITVKANYAVVNVLDFGGV